ncbi:hypothetical protein ABB37_09092 [Leptomonas pyrrhocoris]|uniref:Uncharacterized protein n=1 Tax=Leptomonas pyrrhocoris TaxID=157538 RepID=A0A0N0DRF5_LEPPY|nr:hypothetical protein ABB37_09092 [Leptomonas pyrrhocoris]KPA74384.1 hypothetical protein ABB37_09092 [Leptomonas pyrrhocoris]|eukprot:XP_015652823.1 hypothetical protein ABB37_09092 [Leptomonas pyrrhocoris]
MPNLLRLVTSTSSYLAGAEAQQQQNQHHHFGLFSGHHRHHASASPIGTYPSDNNHSQRHSSQGTASPPVSSAPGDATNSASHSHTGSARHAAYPEALPSALSARFTGPALGTAVMDESMIPLEDAAILFEMVTPESTPLLQSRVKERFEAAIDEVVERRRQAACERARREQQPGISSNDEGNSEAVSVEPQGGNDTFGFFTIDSSVASPARSANTAPHQRRRRVVGEGGYFVFTDSYLSAYPNSVVTGVTSELQLTAAPGDISPFHHRATGPGSEKQHLQEVKDYIREAEHEYRPLFRRRTSAKVYGRGQYLRSSPPDLASNEVYYAASLSDKN